MDADGYGHSDVADKKFVGIAAGNFHARAINVDRTLSAWGSDFFGELDDPSGQRFTEVGAGPHYSMGITRDGRLVAWGDNTYGQHPVPRVSSATCRRRHFTPRPFDTELFRIARSERSGDGLEILHPRF